LDGTREFVTGIPEWCISIALVEDGRPIAAGVCNPATDETFLGCRSAGVTYNGVPASPSHKSTLEQAVVLASRSEVTRGEWKQFEDEVFTLRPTGSVAYKLALIAVGHADVTWTLSPKNEWDIAAGVHLVEAAGGIVAGLDHFPLSFNREETLCSGLYAGGPLLGDEIRSLLTKRCRKALSV
jgi:myo-inositol-1(or 4)-monophosphatase